MIQFKGFSDYNEVTVSFCDRRVCYRKFLVKGSSVSAFTIFKITLY